MKKLALIIAFLTFAAPTWARNDMQADSYLSRPVSFANLTHACGSGSLPGSCAPQTNGTLIYVYDGATNTSPCTGSGNGAWAFRVNGSWLCGPGGGSGSGGILPPAGQISGTTNSPLLRWNVQPTLTTSAPVTAAFGSWYNCGSASTTPIDLPVATGSGQSIGARGIGSNSCSFIVNGSDKIVGYNGLNVTADQAVTLVDDYAGSWDAYYNIPAGSSTGAGTYNCANVTLDVYSRIVAIASGVCSPSAGISPPAGQISGTTGAPLVRWNPVTTITGATTAAFGAAYLCNAANVPLTLPAATATGQSIMVRALGPGKNCNIISGSDTILGLPSGTVGISGYAAIQFVDNQNGNWDGYYNVQLISSAGGTYTNATITTDNLGRVTNAANGTPPVTAISVTPPLTSTGGLTPTLGIGAISLANGGTGTNYGPASLFIQAPNTATGTVLNEPAKFVGSSLQVTATDTSQILGITVSPSATTGLATVQTFGFAQCLFDNFANVGDIFINNNGHCHDIGSGLSAGSQALGVVLQTGAASLKPVFIDTNPYPQGNNLSGSPTVISCGGTSSSGTGSTDSAGHVNIGSPGGPVTSCTIFWANSYTNPPDCTLNPRYSFQTIKATTITNAAMIFNAQTDMSGDEVYWTCGFHG